MMTKRDCGYVEKLLPVLMGMGIVFGLILLSGQFMKVLQIRSDVNQISRAYLLKMESKGYLTREDAANLERSLEKDGKITEIDLAGSTILPAAYGEKIMLCIKGKIKMELQIAIPLFYEEWKEWTVPIEVRMFSTAKH